MSSIWTGSIGRNGRISVAPAIENMFPKFELIAIMMNFVDVAKARRPSVTPRSRTPRSCRSKMMSACVLGDIDRAIDGDADIRGMERRRIVDAVAEKADDMAAVPQPKNDAILLSGRDPAEQVRLLQPRAERFLTERFDLGAGQHPSNRNAEFGADMLRHALVVAAEDLDADTLGPKRGDGRPGARLCGSKKTTKPAKTKSRSSATVAPVRSGSSSRQATPSARNPSALSPSKTFAARVAPPRPAAEARAYRCSSYRLASLMTSSGAPLVISRRRPSCSTRTETRRR